jgi:transketolase
MTVIVPSDANGATGHSCCADYYGPVYVRLRRSKVPPVMPDDYQFKIGRGVYVHTGKDVNIVAMGIMVSISFEAAKILKNEEYRRRCDQHVNG